MKIYLSGPITSDPDYKEHFELFENYVKSIVNNDNVEIVNPVKFIGRYYKDWGDWIIHDLKILKSCDVLIMLPGYENSIGASIEIQFAKGCAKNVFNLYEFKEWHDKTYRRNK